MPQRIVIVGGGVGGTIVANLVARALRPDEAMITLIDATGEHAYMPGWLYLPFNGSEGIDLTRPERGLLNKHVQLVTGEVQRIDVSAREVTVHASPGMAGMRGTGGAIEARYGYDYLVLATGARLAPEDLSGLSGSEDAWHHFYSLDGALRLGSALRVLNGGRIVVAIGGIPYRCPPAPLEFLFLLDEWLRKRGIRERTEIEYLSPLPRVFPIESVAEVATPLLEQRDIHYRVFFNTDEVDTERRVVRSLEGEAAEYDLLVMIPPHRGARIVEEAGLGDEQGWIATDRATLEVKGHEGIYALGDATDLPVSKSGSAAHFEAKVVAARLIAAVRGEEPDPQHATYDGEVMCFLETGHNAATQLVFNYENPPHPPRPSLFYHMEKMLFNRAYWHIVPQGLV
ncbi:MAG: Sulfide:quinone oxidoreductase, Type III [Ktedonobacterales bacterium]|jgi:sulfide:quinone oxidoreductase|nr:MAG: Sulfide:quinone oxidoreductase, Type III [Ktedonobacterales bacterium]